MAAKKRAPVVVVLGHVDHGKTTLLDHIRKSELTQQEAGNITQAIAGYEAHVPIEGYDSDSITFIDTPGHEAFTKLRTRGANVADIAILIVDATASVKPQTIESIDIIKKAKIPFIVALNKIDLNTANVDKVKADLAQHEVLTDDYGGDVPVAEISALKGTGVEDMLEALLIVASDQNFTYDPEGMLEAYVVETHQEKGGISTSCIIKNGTLRQGDTVYSGKKEARVKALLNDHGKRVDEVHPTMPFILLGFKDMPDVGSMVSRSPDDDGGLPEYFITTSSDNDDPFGALFAGDEGKQLKVVIKADNQGSLEALVPKLKDNDKIDIIMSSVGDIAESDVFHAKVGKAIVIGFGVHPSKTIEELARREKVVVKSYDIIYKLIEELEQVSELIKEKEERERTFKGTAKVQATFNIEGKNIAGIKVTKGRFDVHDRVEWYRNDALKDESLVVNIKQRAATVESVKKGEEGGLELDPELDIKQGDVIKSYSI